MTERGVVVRRLARLISGLVYREIDVLVDPTLTGGGPIIGVANHFGGLSDGVLLVDALPTMPRIVARDVIWKVPVAGRIMTGIGGIPVHRRADGTKASNDESFSSCYEALAAGDTLLIFPEGVTQDVPHIAPVKTGAARIALGARAAGVTGVRIVAVGVHYEDKAVFRSRALVNAGPALDVDAWAAEHQVEGGADDRAAVESLTDRITDQLRAVAPDFPDWDTAGAYTTAAEIPLHDVASPDIPLRYGDTQLLAGLLHRADPDSQILTGARAYQEALRAEGVSDDAVARLGRRMPRRESQARLRDLLLGIVLLPYAALGAVIALVPWLLVQAVRLVPAAPAVKATITPGVAALAFGIEWITTCWWVGDQWGARSGALAFLLIPFFLAATVFVAERFDLFWRQRRTGRALRDERFRPLAQQRAELAALVWSRL